MRTKVNEPLTFLEVILEYESVIVCFLTMFNIQIPRLKPDQL